MKQHHANTQLQHLPSKPSFQKYGLVQSQLPTQSCAEIQTKAFPRKTNHTHTQADAFFHYKIPQERENIFKERTTTEISELKPIFPSCISKGFNTSMVWVSTSVKGHFCDSFLQTGLCNDFTHLLCHILMEKNLQG